MDDTAKMVIPHMAKMMGIDLSPKPKWMPRWIWERKKRRQREDALMQWKPVIHEPSEEQVRIMIAQEFRDFAERILGYSHIDPEKSAIPRNARRVNCDRWLKHFNYEPPKQKPLSPRQHKKVLRKAMRETDKKLAAMGIGV